MHTLAILLAIVFSSIVVSAQNTADNDNSKNVNESFFPKEEFLLLNIRSSNQAYIIKEAKLVSIGGSNFIKGTIADIGDNVTEVGLIVYVRVSDIETIRGFSSKQARKYYGNSYKEVLSVEE